MANYRRAKVPNDFQGDTIGSVVAHAFNLGASRVVINLTAQRMHFNTDVDLPVEQITHLGLEDDPSPPNGQGGGAR